MIVVPALEWHVAHACNLTCEACSHYSNYDFDEVVPISTVEQWYSSWCRRIAPRKLAVLGGEPLLNKDIIDIIYMTRNMWNREHNRFFELVTNGILLNKHPDLPKALEETNCVLHISIHGTSDKYNNLVDKINQTIAEWQTSYKFEVIMEPQTLWSRGYQGYGKDMLPFEDNNPEASWNHCPSGQECFTLIDNVIYKCAPLAYLPLLDKKFRLNEKWNPYLSYKPLTPTATDAEIEEFFARKAESVCTMCPSSFQIFEKPDPLIPIKFYKKDKQ